MTKFFILFLSFSIFACTSIKVKVGSRISVKQQDSLENIMAIRPHFDYLPRKWSAMFKQNMNGVWKRLNIKGINYFAFGKPVLLKNHASRTDPNSMYYQAWFGTYVIQADKQVFQTSNAEINKFPEIGIMQYAKLAEYDQMAWPFAMGDEQPAAKVSSVVPLENIKIDNFNVQFFEGTIESHSDLTNKETKLSKLFGMPKYKKWKDKVDAHHNITLKGIYGIWYNEQDKTIRIVYACGSIFSLKNGQQIDNYSKIKPQLIEMIKKISFKSLK